MSMEATKVYLEVYVCLDVDKTKVDTEMLLRCIAVFISVHHRNYSIKSIQEIDNGIIASEGDVIQRGMYCFGRMFETLKLKTKDEVWFLYIGSGHLKMMRENEVTLLLLNKNPSIRECFYTLHKKGISVFKEQTKQFKLQNLQVVKLSLDELFSTRKTIKYKPPQEKI